MQQQEQNYKLLSVNAVSKKLGVGYNKAKQWIQNGIIESVSVTGRFMVPHCKLEKFVMENNSLISPNTITRKEYIDDEAKALSILSEKLKSQSSNGIII